ncbi:hypothetical protein B0H67DRAFT_580535 [Lasiosphaeris hirsuta]|uniref:Extracellular membrane protein CFEM domain-containing protein n=1 Tax=Lasiosphaeris hirsuta TaxID=260670 RepID=A0AA40DXK1_9PEZI|nr:hypothetical protein B0H67DRAFT_580535 [Lasiosphaeris hirsuta]
MRFLTLFVLIQAVTANSAATCTTEISALFNAHPECARSCLGCTDSNESFAHGCDINAGCCQGYNALTFIPLVYGCVKTTCSDVERQMSWEEFMRNCARRGYPVSKEDTPGGYEFVSFSAATTTARPTTNVGGSNGMPEVTGTGDPRSTDGETTGDPRLPGGLNQTNVGDVPSEPKSGLSTSEIVGIALGSVSALAAVVGLVFRWRHLRLVKKQAEVMSEGKQLSSPMP